MHPGDLKPAVAKVINELIEPVRQHFKNNAEARNLLNLINSFKQSSDAPPVAAGTKEDDEEKQEPKKDNKDKKDKKA